MKEKQLLILSDIFGLTPALKELVEQLVTDTHILDPYQGEVQHFTSQEQAYSHFQNTVGLEHYSESLLEYIQQRPDQGFYLLGFSVGASAIWYGCEKLSPDQICHGWGIYGSQIRKHTHLCPTFEMELIFPQQEAHFCVDQLMQKLHNKPRLKQFKSEGRHGFMNANSAHYSAQHCQAVMQHINQTLNQ